MKKKANLSPPEPENLVKTGNVHIKEQLEWLRVSRVGEKVMSGLAFKWCLLSALKIIINRYGENFT